MTIGSSGCDVAAALVHSRILYAEDDPMIRSLSTAILTRAGYAVKGVEDGQRAWAALLAGKYDLVITDNEMPNLTGLELVRRLRAEGMNLPVVVASGSAALLMEGEVERLCVSAMLPKPFTSEDLLKAVEQVFHTSGATAGSQRCVLSPDMSQRSQPPT
jgi:CheY-like chemotaxis protein